MSGYTSQNRGNTSPDRVGPSISRRLKADGWNISPSARKHRYNGIFVSARGDDISVLVDLGTLELNVEAATGIETTISWWSSADDVRWTQSDSSELCWVRFTHKR